MSKTRNDHGTYRNCRKPNWVSFGLVWFGLDLYCAQVGFMSTQLLINLRVGCNEISYC